MAFGEALFLLLLVHAQPVLEQQDAVVHQQLFEHRRLAQELLVFGFAAITHHPFNTGTVVPAAVHQHDLAVGGKMRGVTLEVPLRGFTVGGLGQRHHPALARVEMLADGLDRAALASCIAAFEQHQQALPAVLHPARHCGQFQLQRQQQFVVVLALELGHRHTTRGGSRSVAHGLLRGCRRPASPARPPASAAGRKGHGQNRPCRTHHCLRVPAPVRHATLPAPPGRCPARWRWR